MNIYKHSLISNIYETASLTISLFNAFLSTRTFVQPIQAHYRGIPEFLKIRKKYRAHYADYCLKQWKKKQPFAIQSSVTIAENKNKTSVLVHRLLIHQWI